MRRALLAVLVALALPAHAGAAERLHYEYGPIHITPGQNRIAIEANDLKPDRPGWIVGFEPNLTYADGTVPRVDVIHLHHGVWLSDYYPLFAAGEEKTAVAAPPGYGWRYEPSDQWHMNHMIHNLKPDTTDVYITYDLLFVPDGSPEAAGMQEVRTQWLDVMGLQLYPVFDVRRRAGGADGRYTYPDESGQPGYTANRWVVQEDGVLVGTAGHLHPGGLWTDLFVERGGQKVRVFRSEAKYFEPAGAVSWDVAMTRTPPDWRVGLRKGDVVSISATYDSERASWYEAMGIMPLAFSPGGTGPDPFVVNVDRPGEITHGHLPENDNHGGEWLGLPDPRERLRTLGPRRVRVRGFLYTKGNLQTGRRGRPPAVRAGKRLKFVNRDAADGILHTITACKAPCNRSTGIAYPLANGRGGFDSGNLGTGGAPASGRVSWRTPRDLEPGTYSYFCRVHPFMRGAFRVKRR
jgi:plastocyanin